MRKYKILCIDDSKSVHAFLRDCTSEFTDSFTSAYDGEEALEIFAKGDRAFDLIFLDWEMPKLNGPDTFKRLSESGVQIPVFMLTSKNNTQDIARMLDLGVSEYIMKPFTKDIIFEKIQMVLG